MGPSHNTQSNPLLNQIDLPIRGELAGILALCESKNSNARQGNLAGVAE